MQTTNKQLSSATQTNKLSQGFTLIELMVTISIAAIIMTIAAPSFTGLIQRNATASDANEFIADLNLARSEAIKRNTTVNLTAKTGGWVNGYTINVVTPATVIRDFAPTDQNVTVTSVPDSTSIISFLSNGLVTAAAATTFNLCKTAGADGKSIVISNTGRVTVDDLAGSSCI